MKESWETVWYKKGMGHRVVLLVDDSAFSGQVIICVSRYVIVVISTVFENMRLVLRVFRALVLVMSRGSLITLPTFVRGTVDDSMLGTSALEACIPRERGGLLSRRSRGTIHDDRITSRSIGG